MYKCVYVCTTYVRVYVLPLIKRSIGSTEACDVTFSAISVTSVSAVCIVSLQYGERRSVCAVCIVSLQYGERRSVCAVCRLQ